MADYLFQYEIFMILSFSDNEITHVVNARMLKPGEGML